MTGSTVVISILYREVWSVHNLIPCLASINLFPISIVTRAVPFSTISIIVLQAFGERFSDGEMKFPAALLTTIWGKPPHFSTQESTAAVIESGSRTSALTGKTYSIREANDNYYEKPHNGVDTLV